MRIHIQTHDGGTDCCHVNGCDECGESVELEEPLVLFGCENDREVFRGGGLYARGIGGEG